MAVEQVVQTLDTQPAGGGTQTFSGYTFEPKALMLWGLGTMNADTEREQGWSGSTARIGFVMPFGAYFRKALRWIPGSGANHTASTYDLTTSDTVAWLGEPGGATIPEANQALTSTATGFTADMPEVAVANQQVNAVAFSADDAWVLGFPSSGTEVQQDITVPFKPDLMLFALSGVVSNRFTVTYGFAARGEGYQAQLYALIAPNPVAAMGVITSVALSRSNPSTAITYGAFSSGVVSGGATVSAGNPAGTVNGSLLIVTVTRYLQVGSTITANQAGWTQLVQYSEQDSDPRAHTATFVRIWATGDPTSWSFNIGGGWGAMVIDRFQGAALPTVNDAAGDSPGLLVTQDAPFVNVPDDGAIYVAGTLVLRGSGTFYERLAPLLDAGAANEGTAAVHLNTHYAIEPQKTGMVKQGSVGIHEQIGGSGEWSYNSIRYAYGAENAGQWAHAAKITSFDGLPDTGFTVVNEARLAGYDIQYLALQAPTGIFDITTFTQGDTIVPLEMQGYEPEAVYIIGNGGTTLNQHRQASALMKGFAANTQRAFMMLDTPASQSTGAHSYVYEHDAIVGYGDTGSPIDYQATASFDPDQLNLSWSVDDGVKRKFIVLAIHTGASVPFIPQIWRYNPTLRR